MKKLILCLALVLALAPAHAEESVDGMRTVDEQLGFIDARTAALGTELEFGGWDEDLIAPTAGDVSWLVPPNLEGAVQADALPDSMMGKKFVALFDDGTTISIYGCVTARLPDHMRAARQIEADGVLYIRMSLERSNKSYIPPATSYNRHYDVYAYDLATGEIYLIWSKVNYAKSSGQISQLDGDRIGPEEMWYALRPVLLPRATVASGGATFSFAITGTMCCLIGVEAPADIAALEIPPEAEGKPVAMLYDCDLGRFESLESVTVPDGVSIVGERAFAGASVSEILLPDGLKEIGAHAFDGCASLGELNLCEGLETIGEQAFSYMDSLRALYIPSTVGKTGNFICDFDQGLVRLVIGEGMASVPYGIVNGCDNLRAVYLPASVTAGLDDARISDNATVCAPADSDALSWAAENGRKGIACADASGVPEVACGVEGNFAYATFGGDALLLKYLGSDARLTLPDNLGGCPLTAVGAYAFDADSAIKEVVFPECVAKVYSNAFRTSTRIDAYIPNADASIVYNSFYCFDGGAKRVTRIHAPAGGKLEEAAAQWTDAYAFLRTDPADSERSIQKLMGDVRAVALQMGANAAVFWDKFDHGKYAWFARVPEYEMTAPEALAVVRLTPGQYATFADVFTDANGFAKSVNAQYDADYAQASLMTNVAFTCEPAPDGMCAVVILVYRTDILFFAEDEAGNATAALIVSATDIADHFSADYVRESAAQLGIDQIAVVVYPGAEAANLLAAPQ